MESKDKPQKPQPIGEERTTQQDRYTWDKDDRTAASNLKKLYLKQKAENNLTHAKLAAGVGINRSWVSQHLASLAPIGAEAAKAYAKFFKVDIGEVHPRYKDLRLVKAPPKGYQPAPGWLVFKRGNKIVVLHGDDEYEVTNL